MFKMNKHSMTITEIRKSVFGSLFIFSFLFIFSNCDSGTSPSTSGNSNLGPNISSSPDLFYPHPSGWKNSHGSKYYEDKNKICEACHKIREDAPKCISCHPFPHEAEWTTHHKDYVKTNGREKCINCHSNNANLQGGRSGITCSSCHHAEGWREQHGAEVKQSGYERCKNCHENDLAYCHTCHEYPHPEQNVWLGEHSNKVRDVYQGDITECRRCHETGNSGNVCNDCHHPPEVARDHGTYVIQNGLDLCKACHGEDGSRVVGDKSCLTCHNYPHTEAWPQPAQHGVSYLGAEQANPCGDQRCHKNNLQGSPPQVPSCSEERCHIQMPHSNDFENPAAHGRIFRQANRENPCGLAGCHKVDYAGFPPRIPGCRGQGCHDNNFPHPENWAAPAQHGAVAAQAGFNSCNSANCHSNPEIRACSGPGCHAFVPHPPEWRLPARHGSSFIDAGAQHGCSPALCHKADFTGNPPAVPSCSGERCHIQFPHPANFSQPPIHGQTFRQANRENPCGSAGCHRANYEGAPPRIRGCRGEGCHDNTFPHAADWAQPAQHGQVAAQVGFATCNSANCHANPNIRSCSSEGCHTNIPHAANWAQPAQHGPAAYGDNKFSCDSANCHGADFRGGPHTPGCINANCHINYHFAADFRQPGQHGNVYLNNVQMENVCGSTHCHKNDLSGHDVVPACSNENCHPNFPHAANWGEPEQHATAYMASPERNTCGTTHCHKADRSGSPPRIRGCQNDQCHENGILHTEGWNQGPRHGVFYSTRWNSKSEEASCWACHVRPVTISPQMALEDLEQERSCSNRDCHLAYPHIAFQNNGPLYDWLAGPDNQWRAHIACVFAMDRNGFPLFGNSIENTCGGSTENNCHFNGYRSFRQFGHGFGICGQYCHRIRN